VLGDKRPEMIDANLAAFSSGYQAAIEAAAPLAPGPGRGAVDVRPAP
jgi:hypothetical protein